VVRRQLFGKLSALAGAVVASVADAGAHAPKKKLNLLMRSSWEADDPTRGSFPFIHAVVLAGAGHDVQIFLTGEATAVLRKELQMPWCRWAGHFWLRRWRS